MCDTYVDGVGYVCYECKSEFKSSHKDEFDSFAEIRTAFDKFMDSPKDYHKGEGVTVDQFFDKYSR